MSSIIKYWSLPISQNKGLNNEWYIEFRHIKFLYKNQMFMSMNEIK